MYEIMIRANRDLIYAYLLFLYVPIQTPVHSPIQSQCNQVQTNTSTNTDQYQYRQMHTLLFSILAPPVHANTGIGTVKSGAPDSTARAARTASILVYLCLRGFCASQAVHFSGRRINHILLFVVRQFLDFCDSQTSTPPWTRLPIQSRRNDAWWRSRLKHFGACSTQIPHEMWRSAKKGDCQLPSSPCIWSPEIGPE